MEIETDRVPRGVEDTPAPVSDVRRMIPPLLLYHVLVLGGGFLLVFGVVEHRWSWVWIGLALFVAGVGLQLAIVRWSIRRVMRRARAGISPTIVRPEIGLKVPAPRSLCTACGWQGPRREVYCPRCGRSVVRLPGAATEVDRPS